MSRINILNKEGLLSPEDRKEKLEHNCDYVWFKTCLDLSDPVEVYMYGEGNLLMHEKYAIDIASFICWWTNFIYKDLNGFSGFSNVKFEPVNFKII